MRWKWRAYKDFPSGPVVGDCLTMQVTLVNLRISYIAGQQPQCTTTTEPATATTEACTLRAPAPQQEKLWQWEACAPQLESIPCSAKKIQHRSDQISRSVVSDSLWPHESQHTRPPCASPTSGVYSNSCPSSQWCHPAISSSVVPFSSCPQSLPASGSFPMSQLFTWGGQSIGVSALASVLPMNTQDWSPLGWTGWISLQSKGLSRVFSNTKVTICFNNSLLSV